MRMREEGARVQVLSSFAKPDKTNEQTTENEKKGKQPGIGTPEPVVTQWWTRRKQPRTAHFTRRREREMKSDLSEADFERDDCTEL